MICRTVSDLSLFETLEQNTPTNVSVSLLAEIERELLRLRSELSPPDWSALCAEFPKRRLFEILQLGTPGRSMNFVLAESFQARPFAVPSTVHIVNAWEYSLPASRSLRARGAYFSQELSELLRTVVKPRILILGAGRLLEADQAIRSNHLHQAEFVAIEPDPNCADFLRSAYRHKQLQVVSGDWSNLKDLESSLGCFDLIYSPAWLDNCDDSQSCEWLSIGVEMLRQGGRLLAANFAPGSRDAGWMEACWNWHPHFRSEEHLAYLIMQLRVASLRGHAVLRDESGASIFLELHAL